MLLPIPILISTFIGLLSVAIPLISLALFYRAFRQYELLRKFRIYDRGRVVQTGQGGTTVAVGGLPFQANDLPSHANDWPSHSNRGPLHYPLTERAVWVPLVAALALLLFTFSGRQMVRLAFPSGADEPVKLDSSQIQTVDGPEGAKIHVETFGRPNAPTLVFTHGWGTDNTEWYYAKRQLSGQFRLVFWDIPGLGDSKGPDDHDFRLQTMARELQAVVAATNGAPVILVGHSIGGMINLTFCRLFPGYMGHQVIGIVEVDSSYTNPVTTAKDASINEALQKPVGEPVLHAMIYLSPLVRAMNWLSYENGTAHLMNAQSAFAGSETWGQLDLIARYGYQSSPEVVARGTLGMFHWDAKPVLARIDVPVLILVGQQDTTTLPSASVFMQRSIPRATLQNVSPSAHYGLLEQNSVYNSAIASFAESCFPAQSAR